jgi:hypothetical protein
LNSNVKDEDRGNGKVKEIALCNHKKFPKMVVQELWQTVTEMWREGVTILLEDSVNMSLKL